MKPEPLRGKIMYGMLVHSDNSNFGSRDRVIEQYQELAKALKSAVEFYDRYKDQAGFKLLAKEQRKAYEDANEWEVIDCESVNGYLNAYATDAYNNWLFKYCFRDVIE